MKAKIFVSKKLRDLNSPSAKKFMYQNASPKFRVVKAFHTAPKEFFFLHVRL